MKPIRTYDRNERSVRIVVNCDVLRDAADVLEHRHHNWLAWRITMQCRGVHPMSDADVEVPTLDLPHVEQAIALVA